VLDTPIGYRPTGHGASTAIFVGMLKELIDKDRAAFGALLAANQVSRLYAFGSSVHGPFGPDSDVDVLVELDAADEVAGRMLINIWNGLEDLFQRPVDLLTESSLRNPYLRAEIERTKKLIYDGSKRQVLV
jgi:predicted nucleotidyltransferase